ncbi:MAG TPA: cytochrome c biogenesis protein CcdA [Acidimicrobiales bacterium]
MSPPAAVLGTPGISPGLLGYAFTLGLVTPVNPCAFPLLPAWMAALVPSRADEGWAARTGRGLTTGTSVTVGFVVAFGAVGLLADGGAQLVRRWAPWLMVLVGVALVAGGISGLAGRSPRIGIGALRTRGRRGVVAAIGFGVSYAAASVGCALPLFVAGIAGSFEQGGALDAVGTLLAYSLGVGLLLVVTALLAIHAGAPALRRLGSFGRCVPAIGSAALVVTGAYLTFYWVITLVGSGTTPAPIAAIDAVQAAISGWLAASPGLAGVALGAVVLIACGVVIRGARGEPRRGPAGRIGRAPAAGRRPAPTTRARTAPGTAPGPPW